MIEWLQALIAAHPVATVVIGLIVMFILGVATSDDIDDDGGPHGWTYDPRSKP